MPLIVDIVSPEEVLLQDEADMVITRSADGEIAFLPGHIPFIGVLKPNTVRVHLSNGKKIDLDVQAGFLEVANDRITVLSDSLEVSDYQAEVHEVAEA